MIIEEGTKILLHFGDTAIPGILNDCDTAQALIEKLPYTVHMNSYSHDFCGVMPDELPYNEEEVHYGWLLYWATGMLQLHCLCEERGK
jgi:hypothetical protein